MSTWREVKAAAVSDAACAYWSAMQQACAGNICAMARNSDISPARVRRYLRRCGLYTPSIIAVATPEPAEPQTTGEVGIV